jgi:hypothetical protein
MATIRNPRRTFAVLARTASLTSSIATDIKYEVVSLAVEDSVKGRFAAGDTATVIVPGGKFRFPNGAWAETLLKGVPPPIVGQKIYAFLKPNQLPLVPRVLEAADPFPVLTPIHSSVGLLDVNEAGNIVVRQWARHQTFVISGTSESDLRQELVAAEKNRTDGSR